MDKLRQKIERIMRSSPGENHGLLGLFLNLASRLYSLVMRLRFYLYSIGILQTGRVSCKVISVGNITVGGTGKTPMVIHLASLLSQWGVPVAIASRGYGGSRQKQGGVVSDGERILLSPAEAGDEPWLMAAKLPGVPVVVGGNRVRSGNLCVEKFNTRVLILDDAFSHLAIARDLNLLLVDSKAPFGNGRLIPGGVLREPADYANRADAIIKTRANRGNGSDTLPEGQPIFSCNHQTGDLVEHCPVAKSGDLSLVARHPVSMLKGKKILAFSGIADNPGFFDSLKKLGAEIGESLSYPDHHTYTPEDRTNILQKASKAGVQTLVTTEKDLARLAGWNTRGLTLYALEITMAFEDNAAFENFLQQHMNIGGT
ncbi:MAG: tetraacyldisaccharide 4'-kinase [Desulfatibacillum sp.]|nr:tetraacyldisaccharide 4'-kinase [Desulfatibacillum sp.]